MYLFSSAVPHSKSQAAYCRIVAAFRTPNGTTGSLRTCHAAFESRLKTIAPDSATVADASAPHRRPLAMQHSSGQFQPQKAVVDHLEGPYADAALEPFPRQTVLRAYF